MFRYLELNQSPLIANLALYLCAITDSNIRVAKSKHTYSTQPAFLCAVLDEYWQEVQDKVQLMEYDITCPTSPFWVYQSGASHLTTNRRR